MNLSLELKEYFRNKALLCSSRIEFSKRFNSEYQKAYRRGWLDEICDHMKSFKNNWSKEECLEKAKNCKSKKEFETKFKSYYYKASRKGWLNEICGHMKPLRLTWSLDEIKKASLECDTKTEFLDKYPSQYYASRRLGIFREITKHMITKRRGFSKKDFCNFCDIFGTFYIIKCSDKNEWFYKLGITSKTIKDRFKYLPYSYEVITFLEDKPADIFELEAEYKKKINKYKYIPIKNFNGFSECFKCNKNNSILRLSDYA